MKPADYDGWYDSPRGRWIGEAEHRLLLNQLEPRPGDHLLDVGCGTGWFTRRLAGLPGLQVTGIDPNAEWLEFARSRDTSAHYLRADARALPFESGRFDLAVSVTALCFVPDWQVALDEMLRVTRRRFAIGVLNRNSLLWRQKGQGGGSGAYRGAHWHTAGEIRSELDRLHARNLRIRTAIFLPSGSPVARAAERMLPSVLPWGGFTLVSGNVPDVRREPPMPPRPGRPGVRDSAGAQSDPLSEPVLAVRKERSLVTPRASRSAHPGCRGGAPATG